MANTFREIVELWPSPDALAEDIGAKFETVRKWRQRDNIPAEWWLPVIDAAKARNLVLTSDQFAAIAARKIEISRETHAVEAAE